MTDADEPSTIAALQRIESLPVEQRSGAYLAHYRQLLDRLDASQ